MQKCSSGRRCGKSTAAEYFPFRPKLRPCKLPPTYNLSSIPCFEERLYDCSSVRLALWPCPIRPYYRRGGLIDRSAGTKQRSSARKEAADCWVGRLLERRWRGYFRIWL